MFDFTKSGRVSGKLPHRALLLPLHPSHDNRGYFAEVFCDHWTLPVSPKQWSVVRSISRVLRGMHVHLRHDEYISVIQGAALVGLYDLRPDSPTCGESSLTVLCEQDPACLSFAAGVLHGWYFPENTLHLQAVSEEYGDYYADDNNGCIWSDPALNLDWPDKEPVLAERAANFGNLEELKASVQIGE